MKAFGEKLPRRVAVSLRVTERQIEDSIKAYIEFSRLAPVTGTTTAILNHAERVSVRRPVAALLQGFTPSRSSDKYYDDTLRSAIASTIADKGTIKSSSRTAAQGDAFIAASGVMPTTIAEKLIAGVDRRLETEPASEAAVKPSWFRRKASAAATEAPAAAKEAPATAAMATEAKNTFALWNNRSRGGKIAIIGGSVTLLAAIGYWAFHSRSAKQDAMEQAPQPAR